MNDENTSPRKYKRHDENFKRAAVEMWLQGGKSAARIARELGISTQSLKQWKKQPAASIQGRIFESRIWSHASTKTSVPYHS